MSPQATHCTHCSAAITQENTKFCPFCGTILPTEPVAAPLTLADRFDALEAHKDFHRFMRHKPSTASHTASNVGGIVVGVVTLVIFALVVSKFSNVSSSSGAPAGFMLIPLLVLGVIGFKILSSMGNAAKFSSAPMRKRGAVVIDERTKVSGGGRNSSAKTSYFVTLEDKRGKRHEYEVRESLAGSVGPGDIGVAFSKSSSLVAFKRVRI